ncbi:MAG: hypothetical protein IIA98_07975, partial [Proteobacteria bacterium]|nr:hypothetical protein [Pseudomonadota bacterium]
STNITNDIALGLKISLEEAEDIKKGATNTISSYPQKKLDEIIEARLKDIFDLIETHLKKLGRNELLPAGIILTGGGLDIATIEDIARASLKLPARIVVPHAFSHGNVKLDTAWSVAYGLCILGFDTSYTSDLIRINKSRIKGRVRNVLSWIQQFLP